MRHLLTPLVAALLCLTALACGSATATHSKTTSAGASVTPHRTDYSKDDGDRDSDDGTVHERQMPNDNVELLASYPRVASPAEAHMIAAIVKRYYAASAAEDGATACSLLAASLASGLAEQGSPGADTCAATISRLLAKQHQQLLAEQVSTMAVEAVRLKGTLALVVLAFRAAPESDIILEREGSTWKLGALFGSDMT